MTMISNPASALYRYHAGNKGKFLSYKDFGENPELTLTMFKDFYFECFPSILYWFYPNRDDESNMILSANMWRSIRDQYGEIILPRKIVYHPLISLCHNQDDFSSRQNNLFYSNEYEEYLVLSSLEQYFFSASVFFTKLIPQVLTRALGISARRLFLKTSGWPEMSAGLGYLVSAEQWLKESDGLLPCPGEAQYYNSLLDVLLPFFSNEVEAFLSGREPSISSQAYGELTKIAVGRTDIVLEELSKAVDSAKEHFRTGQIPVYYLSHEELYGNTFE